MITARVFIRAFYPICLSGKLRLPEVSTDARDRCPGARTRIRIAVTDGVGPTLSQARVADDGILATLLDAIHVPTFFFEVGSELSVPNTPNDHRDTVRFGDSL